ncbi:hypothetical protein GCM10010124_28050 [Pilimelia terevasa]|uniref:Uncharacterized protein n=1 Tax=Pilimelia terevasa TaxID=53372 RepID=A0A8J3BT70_9ACTN|nr:DUF5944 family protein [Pilimelia terevasa]GGK33900.1 hypothetical protein GCM10010124_28050 [Pilimelia terevasa]
MTPSFAAYLSSAVARNDHFAATASISEVFGDQVVSRVLPADRYPVTCRTTSEAVEGGVRLTFRSRVAGLDRPTTVVHKVFFIDREEVRTRLHHLTPDQPEGASELLVMFDGTDRDYCHASVYDSENRLLATDAVVFDSAGRTVPYPFTDRYVSPHALDRAELSETRTAGGQRALRFAVALRGLSGPQPVVLAWQAIGRIDRATLICTPDRPEVHRELALDDNPALAPGDWVVVAVDDQERFLAQALVTLQPIVD